MNLFFSFIAGVTLLAVFYFLFRLARGFRSIASLKKVSFFEIDPSRRVSVVIAARNEEKNIEAALRSILKQDHPNFEVIVVNDRSADATPKILDRLVKEFSHLRVFHLAELPQGWLGKNHALYFGAQRANGSFLLFTDADVMMESTVLRKAVGYMESRRLDHLAVGPEVSVKGLWLEMLIFSFAIYFSLSHKLEKVSDPKSEAYVGVGAFNLLRRETYEAVGGLKTIAMRPDDDTKLGKLIKQKGFKQEFSFSDGLVSVEWYASIQEMIQGLSKNTFSFFDYRLVKLVFYSVAFFVLTLWPFMAVSFLTGKAAWLNAAVVFLMTFFYWGMARLKGHKSWAYLIGFPVTSAILLFILWKSALTTLIRGGITWRETYYSLTIRIDKLHTFKKACQFS